VLVAAAVCPHPPLLVPAVAAGAAPETAQLRQACSTAIERLYDASAEELVVVGNGPIPGTARPDEVGSLEGFGVPVRVSLGAGPPTDGPGTLPLSVTIGAWLLRETGYDGPIRARVVTEGATPAECTALGARLAAYPRSTALLVMGDGSARRTERSPGYVDPRAVSFDESVAKALATGDAAALRALDPALATELLAPGRGPWQVLAGAVDGRSLDAELLYQGAPYGVGYFVASWRPR
jgi:hypothetical protein